MLLNSNLILSENKDTIILQSSVKPVWWSFTETFKTKEITKKEIRYKGILRQKESFDLLFFGLLFAILLSLLFLYKQKKINILSNRKNKSNNKKIILNKTFVSTLILSSIILGLFFHTSLEYVFYSIYLKYKAFYFSFIIAIIIILWFFARMFILYILSILFELRKEISFVWKIRTNNFILTGFILFPIIVVIKYFVIPSIFIFSEATVIFSNIFAYLGCFLIVILYVITALNLVFFSNFRQKIPSIYIFLYLCTVEILPVFIFFTLL